MTAPATLSDTTFIVMAAKLTGWKMVRCVSLPAMRIWHQTVMMTPLVLEIIADRAV